MRSSASQTAAALAAMPAPGSGSYITNPLRVANLGIAAGYLPADVFKAVREATPRGSRVRDELAATPPANERAV